MTAAQADKKKTAITAKPFNGLLNYETNNKTKICRQLYKYGIVQEEIILTFRVTCVALRCAMAVWNTGVY